MDIGPDDGADLLPPEAGVPAAEGEQQGEEEDQFPFADFCAIIFPDGEDEEESEEAAHRLKGGVVSGRKDKDGHDIEAKLWQEVNWEVQNRNPPGQICCCCCCRQICCCCCRLCRRILGMVQPKLH